MKAHNFDIINVKKKFQLGFIRINSLLNNSRIYSIFLMEEQIEKIRFKNKVCAGNKAHLRIYNLF